MERGHEVTLVSQETHYCNLIQARSLISEMWETDCDRASQGFPTIMKTAASYTILSVFVL